MSLDALLWICTLLFAATMLILSAMRHAEAAGAAGEADSGDDGVDLGHGWTLGGDGSGGSA